MAERPQTLRPTKQQQIRDFLLSSFAKGVYSFLGGAATAALAKRNPKFALAGLPIFVASSAVLNQQAASSRILYIHNFYRLQLAALGGKPDIEWTLDDTKHLLKEHKDDPRFAIFKELDAIAETTNNRSLLTGLAVGIISSAAAFFSAKRGIPKDITYIGTAAGAISGSIDHLFFSENSPKWSNSVNRLVKDIDAAANNGPISPLQVLLVFTKAQPELEAKFKERFGHSYQYLNYPVKTRCLAMVDEEYGITEITNKINEGVINARELGWLAYGMHSGVPERKPMTIHPSKPGHPLEKSALSPSAKVQAVTSHEPISKPAPALAQA